MGSYLNPGNGAFRESLRSKIYVDKTGLIEKTNEVICTEQKYVCVSLPRRFGKSMAANMLSAYYDCSVQSDSMFEHLSIRHSASYQEHLNQYDVIKVNMQEFLSTAPDIETMLLTFQRMLLTDLKVKYSDDIIDASLIFTMKRIYARTGHSFIILIDEWDCLFREYQHDQAAQKKYLDFLRAWLKDQEYVGLAYMTGILPVKKYGSHSALNMFTEFSMTDPGELAPFFGFTESEVLNLCKTYNMSFEEAKAWYNGYTLISHNYQGEQIYSMYSPKSVVEAMLRHRFGPYWNQTETYEALRIYIQMNMDGLKDAITLMLGGASVPVSIGTFNNDMTTFATKDDVLTLLVHLGYLTYNVEHETVTIPNREVSQEYINAIRTMDWHEVIQAVNHSRLLLDALWNLDSEAVAQGIEQAHNEISVLKYNDENSLSCTIILAFYFAREYYTILRELPSGKGFADICLLPRRLHSDKPAVIIELKWDKNASGAIEQIKERNYVDVFKDYHGDLLLAGINYDKKSKKHSCIIEKHII